VSQWLPIWQASLKGHEQFWRFSFVVFVDIRRYMRVAAIQLESVLGDIDANLAACEQLAEMAALEGAEWIILPEFFTTGMEFLPELAQHSLPPDGLATTLLSALARRHVAPSLQT